MSKLGRSKTNLKGMDVFNEQQYGCPDCGQTELTSMGLDLHLRIDHVRLFPFECDQCRFVRLPSLDCLREHLKSVHADRKHFKITLHYDMELEDLLLSKKLAVLQFNSTEANHEDVTTAVRHRETRIEEDGASCKSISPSLATEIGRDNNSTVTFTAMKQVEPISTTPDCYIVDEGPLPLLIADEYDTNRVPDEIAPNSGSLSTTSDVSEPSLSTTPDLICDGVYPYSPLPIVNKANAVLETEETTVNDDIPLTSADLGQTSSSTLFCAVCNDATPITDPLAHICQLHLDPPLVQCPLCPKGGATPAQVEDHLEKVHPNERHRVKPELRFSAVSLEEKQQAMKKSFPNWVAVRAGGAHQRKCGVCELSVGRGLRRLHVLKHMEVKPFSCPKCPLKSESKARINSHIRANHDLHLKAVDASEKLIDRKAYLKLFSECFPKV